jgi:hypothetical protein
VAINNIPVQQYSVTTVAQEASLNRERRASACGVSVSALDVHRVLPLPCLTGRQREREKQAAESRLTRSSCWESEIMVAARRRSGRWIPLQHTPSYACVSCHAQNTEEPSKSTDPGLRDIRPGCLPSVDSRTRESPDHASSPRRPDGVYVVAGPRHGARFERQDPGDSWASPFRQTSKSTRALARARI